MRGVAIAAIASGALLFAQHSDAAVTSSARYAGWTVDPRPIGGAAGSFTQPSIVIPSTAQAGRSKRYQGTQYIKATYFLYWWNGSSWVYANQLSDGAWVRRGKYVRFDGAEFGLSGYADWSINIRYRWYTPRGGLIGYRLRRHIHAADYQCFAYQMGVCSIRPNGGRYGMFLWSP